MRFKAAFAVGLAAGYVLGTRSGRERYEQIKRVSASISNQPAVKHAAEAVQAQASQLGGQARRVVQEKAGTVSHELIDKVTSKLPNGVSSRFVHHPIDLEQRTHADGARS